MLFKSSIKDRATRSHWHGPQRLKRYDEASAFVDPDWILVQELIPGRGRAHFLTPRFCAEGRALAWLIARRTRQYLTDFGRSSSFVEMIDESALDEPARRLLAAVNFSGLVEL